ncbi:maleylpyruvate isomerase family mycothiol-dependent enzyme [Nocardioides agariphilus]|jgi:maleylpyruvate isomerase|uniref:Maleylpyruvate isomerase family mycothiol-dependent enzyme n=1 Tax=Nocardioides agariphilus TaxID=433664 RepID=A0A930VQ39_9ACTN|nr:maleylpyruvate isomerase family mycothiol-dependent enzyme [Nocardioides agariphilus]MBF4767905.1 maleylpyruvate isomerase family mycothiol-dependent enzyme [Nocardioides agariphilus]
MDDLDPQAQFALLAEATQRLVRTVDSLDDDDLDGPSGLPDWSRAHVVAHLALNAEAMTGVLRGRIAGEPTTMYVSDERRAADIEELAVAERAELRERFLAGTTLVPDAVDRLPDEFWTETFERTPGGRRIRFAAIPGMRLREVEIHHVDLDAGFSPTGWSDAFAAHLIDAMVKRAPSHESFRVLATDLATTWVIGDDPDETGTAVSGPAGDLAWWLTGRPPADSLTSTTGALPPVKAW